MSNPLQLSTGQMVSAWKLFAQSSNNRVIAETTDSATIFSGLPVPFFNVVVVTGQDVSQEDLRQIATEAVAFATTTGLPWLFVPTMEGVRAGVNVVAVLDSCGLAPAMPMTGMLADHVGAPVSIPEHLELTQPKTDTECEDIVDVNSAAYGMDLCPVKSVLGKLSFWADHIAVLGRIDGVAVCCTCVLLVDGHLYVALVATHPDHHRKGFADAVMRHALQLAVEKFGNLPTVLHATDAGRPVYERMGYRAISTNTIFMEKRFLEGHG